VQTWVSWKSNGASWAKKSSTSASSPGVGSWSLPNGASSVTCANGVIARASGTMSTMPVIVEGLVGGTAVA
jgi:hypothetical protein